MSGTTGNMDLCIMVLFILTAPVFGSQLSNQTVVEGGRAVFRCYVSGKPEPNVTWYRNGKPIRNRSGSFTIVSK